MHHIKGLAALSVMVFLTPGFLTAADLIEAWAPGLSDFEFYIQTGGEAGETVSSLALGYGAGHGFSLGLILNNEHGGPEQLGAVAFWSRDLAVDRQLDVWIYSEATPAEDQESNEWQLGIEWSWVSGRMQPYLRPSVTRSEDGYHWQQLLGLMLPLDPVELHLELSAEIAASRAYDLRFAVGPNITLSEAVELLPEISWTRHPGSHETSWALSLGCILTRSPG